MAKAKGGSDGKKRDNTTRSPTRNIKVESAVSKGSTVEVTFSPRRVGGKSTGPFQFECSSEEHAELLSYHAPRINARSKATGLKYTLNRLAGDYQRLCDARKRAAKLKKLRKNDQQIRESERVARLAAQQRKKFASQDF